MECRLEPAVVMAVIVKVRFRIKILEYETIIKLCYDVKDKSVSFYKNNINQGVAFTNVPSGLYPSLDLWFESGTIEIIKTAENNIAL